MTARSLDVNFLTIRTTSVYDPTQNVPVSSFYQPFIGGGNRGVIQWASPDQWASTIQISSLGGLPLINLLAAGNPTYLSNFTNTLLSTQNYVTQSYVDSRLFFYVPIYFFNSLVQGYFTGFPTLNTGGYRTYTSTIGLPLFTTGGTQNFPSATFLINGLFNLASFASRVDSNSRATLELQTEIYLSTSAVNSALTFSAYLLNLTTLTYVGDPVRFQYSNGYRSHTFNSLTWKFKNSEVILGDLFGSISLYLVAECAVGGSAYVEASFSEKNGLFFTLDNTYNDVALPVSL
jgi:hypothetical protein